MAKKIEDKNKKVEEKEKKKEKIDENEQKKKSNKKKYFIYFIVVLLITIGVVWYNLVQKVDVEVEGQKFDKVYQLLPYFYKTMNIPYLCLFVGMVIFVFFLNAFMMFLYARLYQKHYKYHQALAAQAIDNFYSSITPGAYGGEIAKVVIFNKQGVKTSNAASVMVMNFIVYQMGLILIGLLSVIFRFNEIISIPAFPISFKINGHSLPDIPFWVFILIGFFLNVLTIALLFLMSSSKTIHNFVINKVITFLGKIKLVKDVEKKKESVRLQVENYRIELKRLQTNIPFFALLFFLNIIIILSYNLYPLLSGLVLNGFQGMESVNWVDKIIDCIAFSNFHQMVTGLVPIPGTAGISEYVFDRLFGASSSYFSPDFYSKGGANLVLLLWRFVTFYLQFAICGIVASTYKTRGVIGAEDIPLPKSRRETVTMSFETIDERRDELELMIQEKEAKKNKQEKKENKNEEI